SLLFRAGFLRVDLLFEPVWGKRSRARRGAQRAKQFSFDISADPYFLLNRNRRSVNEYVVQTRDPWFFASIHRSLVPNKKSSSGLDPVHSPWQQLIDALAGSP